MSRRSVQADPYLESQAYKLHNPILITLRFKLGLNRKFYLKRRLGKIDSAQIVSEDWESYSKYKMSSNRTALLSLFIFY